jgi:hypothetical protein
MQTINTDPAQGITVKGNSAYFSLGSPLWEQLNHVFEGKPTDYTWLYNDATGHSIEWAIANMADWNSDGNWSSAKMRLKLPLGYGRYEQSIKVAKGPGMTTTFYLCEKDRDQIQEIDFEFTGNPDPRKGQRAGNEWVWTNIYYPGFASGDGKITDLWTEGGPRPGYVDSTQGWFSPEPYPYRYAIDWGPKTVSWYVDRTGSGNSFECIRTFPIKGQDEALCHVFFSFWPRHSPDANWCPDGSEFDPNGAPKNKVTVKEKNKVYDAYQSFFFQPLSFTPGPDNKITRIGT